MGLGPVGPIAPGRPRRWIICGDRQRRFAYLLGVETTVDIVEALRAENQTLRQKLAQFEHELMQLKRLVFGTKSERFLPASSPDQLPLFEGTLANSAPEEPPALARVRSRGLRKKPVRQVLPSHLPREVVVIEPDLCTTGLKKIGEVVTETLDYRPARLVVLRRVRPKYVDPLCEERGVVIGTLPARPVEKGMAEPSLLAHVVIEKYIDHLPLYRQVQRFKREGITLSDSTLGGWIAESADLLLPLYDALRQQALKSGYLQADETPIAVQSAQQQGTTHRGYYWVYHAPLSGLVVMDYQPGRGRDGPKAFLRGYAGALQTDGYVAYDDFDRRDEITCYGCWAHARRYFHEALASAPEWAEHALEEIGRLYDVERMLREREASPQERRRLRQEQALPVLRRLRAYLEANPGLPKSPWGQAVSYSLSRWAKLCRYTEDGRIEIDNNLIENAIRPIALGRRNYLFAGSHAAAERAAVLYSLVGTCKQHAVNPQQWLSDVLGRIATHPMRQIGELLPPHWKRASKSESGS